MAPLMLLFVCVCAFVVPSIVAKGIVERCLGVDNRLDQVFVHFDSHASFCIDELAPNSAYEIKVSVHSIPADVSLQLAHYPPSHAGPDKDMPGPASTSAPANDATFTPLFRALEKLALRTDSMGNIVYSPSSSERITIPHGRAWLVASARLRSPVLAGQGTPQGVQFDLRLDPLLAGGRLPAIALPMIGWAACSLLLAGVLGRVLWTRAVVSRGSSAASGSAWGTGTPPAMHMHTLGAARVSVPDANGKGNGQAGRKGKKSS